MTEKRKPHFALADVKAAMADPARLNRTYSSKTGADDLGMDDEAVVAVVQALRAKDFDKSMTSMADRRVWQDVYKPMAGTRRLYVKLTEDAQGNLLLISFKEA